MKIHQFGSFPIIRFFHPQKLGRVKVVFDCAAKYKGISLNDQLLQGPDLTNGFVGVLTRFRQEPIVMVADLEGTFHQVRVAPRDCQALRFLWWPKSVLTEEPVDHQMHASASIRSYIIT